MRRPLPVRALRASAWLAMTFCAQAWADAGPPFQTNDPGTPGNGNWEINLSSTQEIAHDDAEYQLPQFDLNYGLGERLQLTASVPYLLARPRGGPTDSGWSNHVLGVKWRFLDQGEDGWQMSIFPQYEAGLSLARQSRGLGGPGKRLLLPLQVAHRVGAFSVNVEAGTFVASSEPRERILGLVVGRQLTERLDLNVELFDDRMRHTPSPRTTLDVGGRYQLNPAFAALFMAGRALGEPGRERPQFSGFFGVQILLSDYGRRLRTEP